MQSSLPSHRVLRDRQRLRVGHRFLRTRPRLVLVGGLANATCLALSPVPLAQRVGLGAAFFVVIVAFFAEAWWLGHRPLTARWLQTSLGLTMLVLTGGALLSGAIASPLLPLLFTPVVVGFAAFGHSRASALGLSIAGIALLALAVMPPVFPAPPPPWGTAMTAVGALLSLALLAVGVTGLVEAHAEVAATLDRMRRDVLAEAEQRALSVESLGARVAHEVKNPLTAARALVQLVQRKVDDPRDRERLDVVVTEVDRALVILRDYLSLSRPLADLAMEPIDARSVLEDVAGVIEARAEERRVELRIEGPSTAVFADPQRLRDAVLNLALNAIQAMPTGGLLVLGVAPLAPSGATLTVTDGGLGMSPQLVARLGAAFVTGAEGGTGLGVVVARSVAAQHGGRLRFESELGSGTRAIIDLPGVD